MQTQSSSAYDFSRFEPKRVQQPVHQTEERNIKLLPPKKKSAKQAKMEATQTAYKTIKIFLLTTAFVSVLAAQIYSTVKLDEINHEITKVENNMAVAVSENTRLNMELDSLVGLTKVEDYAVNKLGMVKQENYKVEYIDLSQGDRVVLSQAKGDGNDSVKTKFQKLLAYIF
ncbi:MAG: hypothetical protein K5917_03430 [Clostridiales bacterium]|nr:hypothetical protein [Clostridiales bacterium]